MKFDWVRASLQRRLLVSLLMGVGVSLAAFQIIVDQLVDRYIERSFAGDAAAIERRDRLLREVDFVLLGGVVTVLGVCALSVVLAVRRGLAPLERLASAAQNVAVERPAHALPLEGLPAELRPVGERLNQLLERLTRALEHERRFAASFAHELRTPLAEIRALAEAGLSRQDVAGLHEFLRQTAAAAVGMQGVIESLLAVARADRMLTQQTLEPLAVGAAVQARIERFRLTHPQEVPRMIARVPQELWIQSDPRLLDTLLLNLLANAIQHGDRQAPIEIDWLSDAARRSGALQVRNLAPQLRQADLAHLTERPWSAVAERGSTTAGAGLGLWMVARLCRVLGLTLSFGLDERQWLSVRLGGFRVV